MGIYMRDYDISGFFSEGSAWFALAPMVWFAASLGEAVLASKWALRTVETADSIAADPRSKFVLLSAVPPLLVARDYEEVVNYTRESAMASTMRPQFNVSEEMRALRPELAAIEENW